MSDMLKFINTNHVKLTEIPIEDGNFIMVQDESDIYIDLNGERKSYTGKIAQYLSYLQFPIIGKENILYIDQKENSLYRWDDRKTKYYNVSGLKATDNFTILGGSSI